MEAGTLIRIESSDGTDLLTFAPKKAWQSVVFSAPVFFHLVRFFWSA